MGNACSIDDINPRDTLVLSIRERQREEDEFFMNLEREKVIHEARQKAIKGFNLREGESISGSRSSSSSPTALSSSSFKSCMEPSLTDYANHRSQLLASMEKHLPQEETPVICFTSEIQQTDAPMFMVCDHMGRLVEVLVSNPGASRGDDDRFVPFFHPNSPLSREAVTDIDAIKSTGLSPRRLRFLEKSEDVEEHLKRMAPRKRVHRKFETKRKP